MPVHTGALSLRGGLPGAALPTTPPVQHTHTHTHTQAHPLSPTPRCQAMLWCQGYSEEGPFLEVPLLLPAPVQGPVLSSLVFRTVRDRPPWPLIGGHSRAPTGKGCSHRRPDRPALPTARLNLPGQGRRCLSSAPGLSGDLRGPCHELLASEEEWWLLVFPAEIYVPGPCYPSFFNSHSWKRWTRRLSRTPLGLVVRG